MADAQIRIGDYVGVYLAGHGFIWVYRPAPIQEGEQG